MVDTIPEPVSPFSASRANQRGGFLGGLERFGSDLYNTAVSSPAGIYHAGKAFVHDIQDNPLLLSPVGPFIEAERAAQGKSQLYSQVFKPMVTQTVQDFRHPLSHPGYTALDALALLSLGAGTAARVGEVSRALRAGEGAGGAARAIIRGPNPGTLALKAKSGVIAEVPASRSALSRLVQRRVTELRNRFPDTALGLKTQTKRVGDTLAKQRELDYAIRTGPARGLAREGRRIHPHSPQGLALRAVAEGTSPEQMQHLWAQELSQATRKLDRKRLQRQIGLAERAKKYLATDEQGVLSIKPEYPALVRLSAKAENVALAQDVRLAAAGVATPEALAAAIHKPGRVYRGAKVARDYQASIQSRINSLQGIILGQGTEQFGEKLKRFNRSAIESRISRLKELQQNPTIETAKLLKLISESAPQTDLLEALNLAEKRSFRGAEDFQAGRYHIGQQYGRKSGSIGTPPGRRSGMTVNTGARIPSRLTHQLTGANQQMGRLRHDVPALVAQNVLESERHAALLRAGEQLYQLAQDTPEGIKNPVAIKAPDLYGKALPQPVQDLQEAYRRGGNLNARGTNLLGMAYDAVREKIFPPDVTADRWPGVNPEDIERYKGVKWIDKNLLGGLNEPPLLATLQANKYGRMVLSFTDAVNNATKFALLYLKPAYITPNVVGNAFLVLTQQGVFAPRNIGRAVLLHRKLGPEDVALMDTVMGEGLTASLGAEQGVLHGAVQATSKAFGVIVDLPFRRASFIYEARRAGFKTASELHDLLHDEHLRPQLAEIQQRANHAIIVYGELNPMEQALIRRILFLYPWLKGSTRYAAEYVRDHPQQAALLGEFGQQGEQITGQELGPLPSWGQGLFKVGGSPEFPLVVNPASAGILSQPAQLGQTAAGLLGLSQMKPGYSAQGLLSPFVGATVNMLSGVDEFGRPVPQNLIGFGQGLTSSFPARTLIERLTQDQSRRTYPVTGLQAILQYLLGGIAPRTANLQKLNASAAKEQKPRHR